MSTQWYETFFQGIALETWDRCTPPEHTKAEVDFFVEALQCKPGAHLLDIPCGNGRHCRELAGRGYKMTGIDLSREYIDSARAKDNAVEWICEDMRNLQKTAAYDGAFCYGNSFGYMEHDHTKEFVAGISRALKPRARFLLQACCAESLLPRFREHEWWQLGDILFLEDNRYSAERSCVETEFTFVRNGKTETRSGRQYIYTVAEIQRMLREAGLKTLSLMSGLDKKPFALGAQVLYLVAQKSD